MSERDVFDVVFQFGQFLCTAALLGVTIMKYWFDMHNKKK